MFGKILKYDLKRTYKPLLVAWAGTLLVILALTVLGVGMVKRSTVVWASSMFVANLLLYVSVFAVAWISISRYSLTMHGKAAYFTVTIPAKSSTIVWAKLTYGLIVVLISAPFVTIGALVTTAGTTPSVQSLSQAFEFVRTMLASMEWSPKNLLVLALVLLGVFSTWAGISLSITLARNGFLGHRLANGAGVTLALFLVWFVYQGVLILTAMYVPLVYVLQGSNHYLEVAWPMEASMTQNIIPVGFIIGFFVMLVAIIGLLHATNRRPNLTS